MLKLSLLVVYGKISLTYGEMWYQINILRRNTENCVFLAFYDVIIYIDDVKMTETLVNVVILNLIAVQVDISYCKCNKIFFIRFYTQSLYDVIITSYKSKIFGCRAEFDSVFDFEQHIQKLYVTYENAACIPFQTPLD